MEWCPAGRGSPTSALPERGGRYLPTQGSVAGELTITYILNATCVEGNTNRMFGGQVAIHGELPQAPTHELGPKPVRELRRAVAASLFDLEFRDQSFNVTV